MNSDKQKLRSEISPSDRWNLEAMYPDESAFSDDITRGLAGAESLISKKGHIMDSPSSLLETLIAYTESVRSVERAYIYAHMRLDEDNSNTEYTEMFGRAASALTALTSLVSFIDPEILACEPSLVMTYIRKEPALEMYRFMLTSLLRKRDHTLSAAEENIIASYGEVLRASGNIFTVLNNVDMTFEPLTDSDGRSKDLTLGTYVRYLESSDRDVRLAAYEHMYSEYRSMNNTISAIYANNVRRDVVTSRLRGYGSSLEAALFGDDIPVSVYDNLLTAVHEHLPAFDKYVDIRKRVLSLDELRMCDVYTPLTRISENKFSFDQAVDLACKALAPLGEEYVRTFRTGILEERWVDRYENKNKTSGAYSFGSYDSYPYILMNFGGTLRDVFTLIHEGGHSMHAWYTRNTQPYIYGDHSIFTAEVASTVNETLLINYLLNDPEYKDLESYLINFYIDEFKGTVFRQTMFAEFERKAHEYVEAGGSLTAEWLNTEYDKLNTDYYGPSVTHDDLIQYEWSRIPHFYNSYYVYQYATGFSAANAIVQRILHGGSEARDSYIDFLRSGSSGTPIELLKIAGVDMSSPDPVRTALDVFDDLVDRLDQLMKGNTDA